MYRLSYTHANTIYGYCNAGDRYEIQMTTTVAVDTYKRWKANPEYRMDITLDIWHYDRWIPFLP